MISVVSQNVKLHPSIHSVFGAAQRMQSLAYEAREALNQVSKCVEDIYIYILYKAIPRFSSFHKLVQCSTLILMDVVSCTTELRGINTVYMCRHLSHRLSMFNTHL